MLQMIIAGYILSIYQFMMEERGKSVVGFTPVRRRGTSSQTQVTQQQITRFMSSTENWCKLSNKMLIVLLSDAFLWNFCVSAVLMLFGKMEAHGQTSKGLLLVSIVVFCNRLFVTSTLFHIASSAGYW